MTKKRDDDRPSASNNLNRQLFFEAEIPPQASQDRHHMEVNPQLDRPGLNRLGGIDNGAPFFVMGISGVKKRSENAMRILAMSGNAMNETDVDRRLSSLQAVLELMDSVKDDQDAAEIIADQKGLVLGSLAATLMARREGSPEQSRRDAIAYYRRALQHFIDRNDRPNIAKTKYNMADAFSAGVGSDDRSDGRLALSYLREAISETSPSAGGLLGLMARLNFASLARRLPKDGESANLVEEAIVYVEEVVAVVSKTEDQRLRSSASNTLGALYASRKHGDRRSNLQRAIEYLEESLRERPKNEMPDQWSVTKSNLLSIKRMYSQEFPAEGVEEAAGDIRTLREQRIADLIKQGRPLLAADAKVGLARELLFGSHLRSHVSPRPSVPRHQIASSSSVLEALPCGSFLSAVFSRCRAIVFSLMARSPRDSRKVAEFERSRELIASAITTFRECGAVSEMVQALHLLHVADLALDNTVEAAFHGWQALALSEYLEEGGVELDRIRDISQSLEGLDARVALLFLAAGETAAALDSLELGRARLLRSALRLNTSDTDFRARATKARAKLIVLEREVTQCDNPSVDRLEAFAEARKELAALEQMGGARLPEADDNALRRTWHIVERLMQTYSALIIPVFYEDRCVIAVLAMQGKELRASTNFRKCRLEPILQAWKATDWDEPIARNASIDALMTDLWETFGAFAVQGLMRRDVPIGSRVAIVPQGEFAQLPMTLARDSKSGAVLGDMFEFTVAPSIAALDRAVSNPDEPTLAAIINPTEDLPFSPVEAINCRAVFKARETTNAYLLGAECSKAAVLATLQSRSHWLFSTHGSFDPADVRRSGLQLAGGEFLSLDDLFSLTDLSPPRLVVLSSCDTGHHVVGSAADEFVGLPLGFLQLGAGAVLATRWPVSDVATAFFVSAFMTSHILKGNRPAFALQDGQYWVREATVEQLRPILADLIAGDTPAATCSALQEFDSTLAGMHPSSKVFNHPYYWGGFFIYGA